MPSNPCENTTPIYSSSRYSQRSQNVTTFRNTLTTASYWLRSNLVPYIVFLILVVTSCGYTPAPIVPAIANPVLRPLIALDIQIDTPPLYTLGHEVAVAVANKIDEMAVRVNSG